jgi:iron complex outermembrane receptor protein
MKTIFLIAFFVLALVQSNAQVCNLRLTGHIHSTAAHENVADVTVTLLETGRSIVTDQNGDFSFDNLCAGTYTIHTTHTNYDTATRLIHLLANAHIDIDLQLVNDTLASVTVTGLQPANNSVTSRLSGKELEETRGMSLAEALSKMNGVTMLQTGSGIAKPVIHGLHGNRILTINNGVRQEGQQWGNEHAPEIDPFIANRLTIIKGVDELRFGSDAIGGVILVEPRPLMDRAGLNAEYYLAYSTNNRQWVTAGIWEQQLKRIPSLTYRVHASLKRGANFQTPDYFLNNTASRAENLSATLGLRKEHVQMEWYYSYYHTKAGIFRGSHIGNLSDLKAAIAAPRPDPVFTNEQTYDIGRPNQDVTHHLLKWKTNLQKGRHKFNLLIASQYNLREEYDIVRNPQNTKPQMDLAILTVTEDLQWEDPKSRHWSGVAGVMAMQQDNRYSGRYFIPKYFSNTVGAYAIRKYQNGNFDAQAGARFDWKSVRTNRLLANGTEFDSYDFNFSTFASSIDAGFKPNNRLRIGVLLSLSSRAPHVNELLSNGIHHGTATYEVGNIDLRPERSFHASLNGHYAAPGGTFMLQASAYLNRINNFIYIQPVPDEPVLTIAGAFPKWVYTQSDAQLSGIDFTSMLKPWRWLEWTMKYSMLRARNLSLDDWLIMMPSDRIRNELTWYLKQSGSSTDPYVSVEVENVLRQTRTADPLKGGEDYKVPPTGYTLVHADVSIPFNIRSAGFTASVAGRNLLNQRYRDYLNSFRYFADDIGRNVSIKLKFFINK